VTYCRRQLLATPPSQPLARATEGRRGFNEQMFGANQQLEGTSLERLRGVFDICEIRSNMSLRDEYQIVINEAQRRLIVRALTNAMAYDRRSSDLAHPTPDEWMQLIRLFTMITPSVRKT
jgi:hypothetical protein